MAVTSNTYTVGGSGQAGPYSYGFPILADADVKVSVNGVVKSVTTHYTLDSSNTRITFVSGQEPSTGDKVIVYRNTDEDPINSTFVSGSTIRSNELNDNFSQLLYIAQESDNQSLSKLGGVMEGDLGLGLKTDLYFEGATDNAYETTLTVVDPTADRTITLPNVTGTVVTTGDTGTVATAMIANDAVTQDKIADNAVGLDQIKVNSINSGMIIDGAIATADIGDLQVTTAKLANDAVTNAKIADNAVESAQIANNSVIGNKIPTDAIGSTHIAANAVGNSELADDSVGTNELIADSVNTGILQNNAVLTAKIADSQVTRPKIADDAIDGTKITDDSIDSEHIVDGSIDIAHLSTGCVTNAKLGTDAVTSGKIAAGAVGTSDLAANAVTAGILADNSVDTAALQENAVTTNRIVQNAIVTSHIQDNAVTTAKIADAELTTLAGMQSGTASKLADSTALTADIADLNLLDGKSIVTTIGGSATDTQLASAQAINERIVELVTEVGGFHPVANETSFPSTNPDINDGAGTIVSVKALASNLTSNGSGVATIANGAGSGNTVTINGMSNSTTYAAGKGLILETTSTLHTYTFHRLVMDETGVNDAQTLVTDFNNRYRVASSAPSSSLDDGDLYFDTSVNKMKVYNASSSTWDDVATPGDFYISTFSESFDGSRTAFTVSNAPTSAQQLIVSVNGVVQKPNAGTGQPSEGFTLSGSTVTFSSAPASGSDYYVVALGSTVNIGTPSNNTVSTDKLQNLAVTDAKIANDTISEGKLDIHQAPSDGKFLKYTSSNGMEWGDVPAGVGGANAVSFNDNVKASFGTDTEILDIFQDQSGSRGDAGHNKIESKSAHLDIQCNNNIALTNPSSSNSGADTPTNMALFKPSNAVELYYNGSKKFETTSGGVSITGTTTFSDSLLLGDNVRFKTGQGADLQIYHDGTDSYIANSNGALIITQHNNDIKLRPKTAEEGIIINNDGSVELYHNNVKKCETTSAGVTITGDLTVTGSAPGGVTSDGSGNTHAGTDAGNSDNYSSALNNSCFGKSAGTAITQGDHNTLIGKDAGDAITTGSGNTALGTTALTTLSTSSNNTAIGKDALGLASTGSSNTAVGVSALYATTTADENTAVGLNALQDNTTGHSNVAIGSQAMREQTTANYNTAVGKQCLQNVTGGENTAVGSTAAISMTTGTHNVTIGREAMYDATTGSNNVAMGSSALANCTTGGSNVAIGRNALLTSTTRSGQVAIGQNALRLNDTGYSNTAIGMEALDACNHGYQNVAVGEHAGRYLTDGDYNSFLGRYAGAGLTTGNRNVGIGPYTLFGTCTASDNVAIGYEAMGAQTAGASNIAIGKDSMKVSTTGHNNTCVGHTSGRNIGSAFNNTFIGFEAGYNNNNSQGQVCVGYRAGKDIAGSYADRNTCLGDHAGYGITSGGNNACLGYQAGASSSPSGAIGSGDNVICLGNNSISNLYCNDTSISSSDERDKTDITEWTHGLDWINKLKPVTYRWDKRAWYHDIDEDGNVTKENARDGSKKRERLHLGFKAQDVLAVEQSFGYAGKKDDMLTVNLNEDDTAYGMKYERLVVVLTKAVQELSTKNDALAARIATLEAA